MSDAPAPPTPEPVAPGEPGGFFPNLLDLYFDPRPAFDRIVRSPRWLFPFIGAVVLPLVFVGVWTSRMEPRVFMKTQMQEAGQWDKIPADQREQMLDHQARFMPTFTRVVAPLGAVLTILVVAGVLLLVYRFFYAGEVGFQQALAVTSWSMFAISLLTTPLTLAVMALKDDWNLNPQEVLQANLGLLLDKAEVAKPVWALATSFDLFVFWLIFLLAAGFGVACRKSTGSALWGVVVPWAIVVAVKVGWSALF
jgi:hypothetical protein